jgi:hypothetical protein
MKHVEAVVLVQPVNIVIANSVPIDRAEDDELMLSIRPVFFLNERTKMLRGRQKWLVFLLHLFYLRPLFHGFLEPARNRQMFHRILEQTSPQ